MEKELLDFDLYDEKENAILCKLAMAAQEAKLHNIYTVHQDEKTELQRILFAASSSAHQTAHALQLTCRNHYILQKKKNQQVQVVSDPILFNAFGLKTSIENLQPVKAN
jgi:hypothetical protein